MKIINTIQINKPVEDVWKNAAVDFENAGAWMRGVVHSSPLNSDDPFPKGRVCQLNTDTIPFEAVERIVIFDPRKYILKFDIFPENGPKFLPLNKNTVTLKLNKIDDNHTSAIWESNFDLKPHGKILSPILKLGFSKSFQNILEDLKHFVEHGKAHPAKIKFDLKISKKSNIKNAA